MTRSRRSEAVLTKMFEQVNFTNIAVAVHENVGEGGAVRPRLHGEYTGRPFSAIKHGSCYTFRHARAYEH